MKMMHFDPRWVRASKEEYCSGEEGRTWQETNVRKQDLKKFMYHCQIALRIK
jgi:hypothetical protein